MRGSRVRQKTAQSAKAFQKRVARKAALEAAGRVAGKVMKVGGPIGALASIDSVGEGSDIVTPEQRMASHLETGRYKQFPSEYLSEPPLAERQIASVPQEGIDSPYVPNEEGFLRPDEDERRKLEKYSRLRALMGR